MSFTPIRSASVLKMPDYNRATTVEPLAEDALNPRYRRDLGASRERSARPKARRNIRTENPPIIIHCHLCWDWVWQRPQQFAARLSNKHRILFIETLGPDPELAFPLVRYRQPEGYPNITLLRLQFPSARWNDGGFVDGERRRLVQKFLKEVMPDTFRAPIQWFYDPMAVTAFAGAMGEILTVYDCMDELSKFKGAPPEILERETELLSRADVVFTGGRKLWESKSRHNDNCHFYGCGVDNDHFGKARLSDTKVPADLAALNKPILGYFGVIDERLDYGLIARLADSNPDWSVAMIGPVTKVDPASLPQRKNLHWFGQRPYADLPAYCKGMDVCLMPFALNEATEYINPTKALEYMATGRPVVSTAVTDVVRNFGSVVQIAQTPDDFVRLCRQSADRPDHETVARGLEMASRNSWDGIVASLEQHMEDALAKTFDA